MKLKKRDFLIFILSLQFAFLGLIGLSKVGLEIGGLRQIISFIYLSFIPGILVLRILKLHKLSTTKAVLYSVGLSTSFLIFMGTLINFLYPIFGIANPISEIPLVATITLIVFSLFFVSYLQDKNEEAFSTHIEYIFSPFVLFFCLFPILSFFGAYLLRIHNDSLPLLILLAIISAVPLLIALDALPENFTPLFVFILALSLFTITQIFYPYIYGDLHYTYFFTEATLKNGVWNLTIPHNANTLPSTMILPLIYSIVGGTSLEVVFKAFFTILYAFVPLILYQICQELSLNKRLSFLSSFLPLCPPMSAYYFTTMPRQEIALLFTGLILLSLVDKEIESRSRKILGVLFLLSLTLSHYGTIYLFIFSMIIGLFYSYSQRFIGIKAHNVPVSYIFLILAVVFTLSWHIYIGSSVVFKNILSILDQIISNIYEFLNPSYAHGAYYITREFTTFENIFRFLSCVAGFLITIGLLNEVRKGYKGESKVNNAYLGISLGFLAILLMAVMLPRFSGYTSLDFPRIFSIVLYVTAPFFGFGGIIFGIFFKKFITTLNAEKVGALFLSVFLCTYFLFGSGFAFEFQKECPNPATHFIYAHQNKSLEEKARLYALYFTDRDVAGAKWLPAFKPEGLKVYAGWYPAGSLLVSYGRLPSPWFKYTEPESIPLDNSTIIEGNSYIFLTTFNNEEGLILKRLPHGAFNLTEYLPDLPLKDKIYSNGGAIIYLGKENEYYQ